MKKARYISILALVVFISFAPLVFGQGGQGQNPPSTPGTGPNPPAGPYGITIDNPLKEGTNSLYDFISLVVNNVILPIGGVIAVIYIIYAGFLFVTASGNEAKLKTAKTAFLYAVIGTAILLGAWAISEAVKGTIGQITAQ
jgi:hypothetical protein